jgi:hypothetical protein
MSVVTSIAYTKIRHAIDKRPYWAKFVVLVVTDIFLLIIWLAVASQIYPYEIFGAPTKTTLCNGFRSQGESRRAHQSDSKTNKLNQMAGNCRYVNALLYIMPRISSDSHSHERYPLNQFLSPIVLAGNREASGHECDAIISNERFDVLSTR